MSRPPSQPRVALPSICVVGELPPPTGGMAVQAARLSEGLRAEGHRIINVRTNALPTTSPFRRIKGLRGLVNFVMYLSHLFPGVTRTTCLHIFSHSYLSFFLFTVPAVVLGLGLRRRLVIHYHGGAAADFLNRWHWAAGPFLRAAQIIVVPSGFLADVLSRFGLHTVEIPNILSLDALPFRLRDPLRPCVVMARHLQPAYNIACGIRAFAELARHYPDATLTVAGDGVEREMLGHLCDELGIAHRVRFLGNVDNAVMRSVFDDSDIFLNSSRVDNQPVSMLEAFACGLPVVSTSVGGIPYMATPAHDALLAPDNDAEGLARHMVALLRDPPLAQRLARNARARVEQYSWSRIYPMLADIYSGETGS